MTLQQVVQLRVSKWFFYGMLLWTSGCFEQASQAHQDAYHSYPVRLGDTVASSLATPRSKMHDLAIAGADDSLDPGEGAVDAIGERAGAARARLFAGMAASPAIFSVDMHKLSAVKDQGERGSCSFFATVALLEFGTHERYSEQCLAYFASKHDLGYTHNHLRWLKDPKPHNVDEAGWNKDLALVSASECPYDGRLDGRNNIPDRILRGHVGSVSRSVVVHEFKMTQPGALGDPVELVRQLLVQYQSPVALSVKVVDYPDERYWGYVCPRGSPCPVIVPVPEPQAEQFCQKVGMHASGKADKAGLQSCGSHAIVVVGYDDEGQFFRFKNSWGSQWRDQGFGRLSYDYLRAYYLPSTKASVVE